jgi:LysM repeat protein
MNRREKVPRSLLRRLVRFLRNLKARAVLIPIALMNLLAELIGDPLRDFLLDHYSFAGVLAAAACLALSFTIWVRTTYVSDRWIKRSAILLLVVSLPIAFLLYLNPILSKPALTLLVLANGTLSMLCWQLGRRHQSFVSLLMPFAVFVAGLLGTSSILLHKDSSETSAITPRADSTNKPSLTAGTTQPTPTSASGTTLGSATPSANFPSPTNISNTLVTPMSIQTGEAVTHDREQTSPSTPLPPSESSQERQQRICPLMLMVSPPPASTHLVIYGDSLAKIAAQYGTTVEALQKANALYYPGLQERPDCIREGWWLVIPHHGGR